jgi:hypothetical protein
MVGTRCAEGCVTLLPAATRLAARFGTLCSSAVDGIRRGYMIRYHINQRAAAMPDFPVCKAGEIPDGGTRLASVNGVEIGVIFSKGQYYAYRNRCPHQGGPACEGLKMPRVVEKIGAKGVYLARTSTSPTCTSFARGMVGSFI